MQTLRWLPAPDAEAEGLVARAFGTAPEDLEVDFAGPPEAALTAVLAACLADARGRPFPAAEVSGWTVKRRRQGLIAVAVATGGRARTRTARCGNCGEVVELALDLFAFRADWRSERIPLALGAEVVHLRPPRPDDLAAWAASPGDAEALASRLLLGGPPRAPGWDKAAETALGEDDPLAELVLEAACPDCGGTASARLVLETYLMQDLSRAASALLDTVHVIASAYHWGEAAILALPEPRRRHYLGRIAEAWS